MTRVALVTGAGGDIGRATAIALADDADLVVAADVDDEGTEKTVAAISEAGGQAMASHLDVTSKKGIESLVADVRSQAGPVLMLVNCAGNLRPTRVADIPEEEWDSIVGVNLKGTFLCSQAVISGMQERGWGRIVNVSSTAGKNISTVGGAHYTAAKAGVLGFTRHLANEVAALGITVNAVCPGLIETRMIQQTINPKTIDEYARSFPVPRLGKPEEVAAMIRYLTSEDASYVTGAALDINGGDLMV